MDGDASVALHETLSWRATLYRRSLLAAQRTTFIAPIRTSATPRASGHYKKYPFCRSLIGRPAFSITFSQSSQACRLSRFELLWSK